MKSFLLSFISVFFIMTNAQIPYNSYNTGKEELKVTLLGHASLLLEYKGENIYVDPYSAVADYTTLPKADLILITHEHADHLDPSAINEIRTDNTQFITSQVVKDELRFGQQINNGENTIYHNISIEAVPAYNILHKREDGEFYHPKGRGNGYMLTFDDLKLYIAGDTENIPEMEQLKGKIDIAFLPKNIPYTMTDDMFIDAVRKIEPKVVYPYHLSEFDEAKIKNSLGDLKTTILLRPMKNK